MEKESKTSSNSNLLLRSIATYLSKSGYATIAEDLKSAAKINTEENAIEDMEDYFPHLPKPNPSDPIFTAYIGSQVTASPFDYPNVLHVPKLLLLNNMDRRTRGTDVERFFKKAGLVTCNVTVQLSIPKKNENSDSGESSGSDKKIVTAHGSVGFNSVEDTMKAMNLYGSLMEVSCKRTLADEGKVIIGRPVFFSLAKNNLRTIFMYGSKKEDNGIETILDEAALTNIVRASKDVDVISSFSPENAKFTYFLLRFNSHAETSMAILTSYANVIVREAMLEPKFLEAGLNATKALEAYRISHV